MLQLISAYLITGLVVSVLVLVFAKDKERASMLAMLFDPVWPLILVWPLWVLVVVVELATPKEAAMTETPIPDFAGASAVVISELRPLGKIQVRQGDVVDARSEGDIIPVGTVVQVKRRSIAEWIVEAEPNKAPEPTSTSITPRAIE